MKIVLFVLASLAALAQPPHDGPPPGRGPGRGMPPGKWWNKPEIVGRLKITSDQQRKMDDVFQQSRTKLIDAQAALAREEATLEPLMEAPQLDDSKILPQIDRIAQARSELEKAEARLLLGIRHVLTPDQWRTLQSEFPPPHPRPEDRGDGPPRRGRRE